MREYIYLSPFGEVHSLCTSGSAFCQTCCPKTPFQLHGRADNNACMQVRLGNTFSLKPVCHRKRFTWSQKSSDDKEPICQASGEVCLVFLSAHAHSWPAARLEICWVALAYQACGNLLQALVVEKDSWVTWDRLISGGFTVQLLMNPDLSREACVGRHWSCSALLCTWIILCCSDHTFA